MKRYTLTVTVLGGTGRSYDARVLAHNEMDARGRGIRKLWGPKAFWQSDSGLGLDYGQVFERLDQPGFHARSLTSRASRYVMEGWT